MAPLLLVTLICAACNLQAVFTSTPIPPETQRSDDTSSPEQAPTLFDLVWFAPNMGSRDYTGLFTKPEEWAETRSRINVFKFYTQNVLDTPCSICGQNTLSAFIETNAFQKLTEWEMAISVEVGAVKEWGCTGTQEFRVAKETIQNIQANGGTVAFLAMDEPYIGGEQVANGNTCGLSMKQTADITSEFIAKVKSEYPNVLVGDIEPYPYFSVSELEQWIDALEDRGVSLAFFHLDADIERARVEKQNVAADLRRLKIFLQEHQIPFGVIFTSNWTAAASNRGYFNSTMDWLGTVKEAIGTPQHVIFQSWQGPSPSGIHEIPINIPEDNPEIYSHTRLILEGLDVYRR